MSTPPAILTAIVCLLPLTQGSPQFTPRLRPSLRSPSLRPTSLHSLAPRSSSGRSPSLHSPSLHSPAPRSPASRSSSAIPSLRSLLSRLNRRPSPAGRPAATKTRPQTRTHHQRQQVRRVARPLPAIAYLEAREIPGYQTFQLHHAIRRKEGTEIFEGGRKPEVIHYVSGPTIRTPDLSDKIDERSAGAAGIVAEDVPKKAVEDLAKKVVEEVVEDVVEDVVEKVVEDVVVGRGLTRQPDGVVSTIQIYELSK